MYYPWESEEEGWIVGSGQQIPDVFVYLVRDGANIA